MGQYKAGQVHVGKYFVFYIRYVFGEEIVIGIRATNGIQIVEQTVRSFELDDMLASHKAKLNG